MSASFLFVCSCSEIIAVSFAFMSAMTSSSHVAGVTGGMPGGEWTIGTFEGGWGGGGDGDGLTKLSHVQPSEEHELSSLHILCISGFVSKVQYEAKHGWFFMQILLAAVQSPQ